MVDGLGALNMLTEQAREAGPALPKDPGPKNPFTTSSSH
jgi:hypothetical protein